MKARTLDALVFAGVMAAALGTAVIAQTIGDPSPPSCVQIIRGQTDIDENPPGTRYCITGVHNWTLHPKSGDKFVGGILDGQGKTKFAIEGYNAQNVTLNALEIRNYTPPNQLGAIVTAPTARGWRLINLRVHNNGTVGGGGGGSTLGYYWRIEGGRYWNNRQSGLAGGGEGTVVNRVEVDHNNFTDNTYKKANISCDFEAGGLKWTTANLKIVHSRVHHNACRGIWADIKAEAPIIKYNRVAHNWADGIMVEISSGAKISNNIVIGNGYREFNYGQQPCSWVYGAGIFLSTSSNNEVWANTVTNNCFGITGAQQNRGAEYPILEDNYIHDNTVSGGGKSGMAAEDGTNLATKNNVWRNNQFINGAKFCGVTC